MLNKADEAKPKNETAPVRSAQELEAIVKLGPNPTILELLALHRLDG